MMFISGIGMLMYKNQKSTNIGPVDDTSIKKGVSISLFFALLSFVLLAYLAGQRSWIFDTYDYQYSYENNFTTDLGQISGIISGDDKGKGFEILLVLFKHFSGGADFNAWFLFIAIIQCAALAVFFYKYSVNYSLSVYLFFASGCFLWLVNGMRQFLAATIVLFFYDWISNRKFIPFVILILIVFTIHSSAIFWIPVYFLINIEPWSPKFLILSIILAISLFFVSQSSFLQETEYAYINRSDGGVNPFRVVVMSVPAIVAFLCRKKTVEIDDKVYNQMINLSVICSECYIVGMFSSVFVARIAIYFQLFIYILLPWLLLKVVDEQYKRIIILVCIIGFMAYFYYDMYITGNGIYNSTVLDIHYT
ncbi:MAG: EpsG family protein [Lachnospira sp.]